MIAVRSSLTMRRAITRWPDLAASSASVAPDVSLDSVLVSETVRIAMLTGMKDRVSSIRGIGATWSARGIESGIGGPVAGCKRVEVGGRLPQAHAVDPVIRQYPLDVSVGLAIGDALEEQQGVLAQLVAGQPLGDRPGSRVIGGREQQQVVADPIRREQAVDVLLRQGEVEF